MKRRSDSSPRRTVPALLVTALVATMSQTAVGVPAETAQDSPPATHVEEGWKPGDPQVKPTPAHARGEEVYETVCATCHESGMPRAPTLFILRMLPPSAIYRALTTGAMRTQAQALPDSDRQAVAEYLTGRMLAHENKLDPPKCEGRATQFDADEPPVHPAWGVRPDNTRYIPTSSAGIDARNVGRLRLAWAVGFDGATRARSQPALAGGALYVGSEDGRVLALDRATGCARWTFQVGTEVRTGIVVSPWTKGDSSARPRAFFGDVAGNVYAVDAKSGELVWRDRADTHPSTTITAAPALHGDRLYVPVSSLEEGTADGKKYVCCTFRGSVVAYDTRTGRRVWQSYVVDEPKKQPATPAGVDQWGPSGVAIWNTPAIDEQRGVMYFATGDNYSSPTTSTSDAVIAMDLATGHVKWVYQALGGDAWNASCSGKDRGNCPHEDGPDYDFGAATILATAKDGRQYVLAGQKSGWVYAIDPERGKLVWKTKVGRGGIMAGVYFGMATHDDRVYVPISDPPDGRTYAERAKPGLYALDLRTGEFVWRAPNDGRTCDGRGPQCDPGIAAAVTATDDLVMTGSSDGWIRIYESGTGRVLWQYDTMQDTPTVSGATAKGGSMGGGAGPIAYAGTLIVPSGYGFAGRMPGNVLLVFTTEEVAKGAAR